METISSFATLLMAQSPLLAFFAVYLAAAAFGNLAAFISLWLAFEGTLGVYGVPLAAVAIYVGSASGDSFWYFVGRMLRATRFGHWLKNKIPHHEKIEHRIAHRGRRWILFGKFMYGTNLPVIFLTGWSGIAFREFLSRSLTGITLWLPIIIGVSYALYSTLTPLAGVATLKNFEMFFLAGIALFLGAQYLLGKIISRFFGGDRQD